MLRQFFKINLVTVTLLLTTATLSLSADVQGCSANQLAGKVHAQNVQTQSKWCCCGGCCGYAMNCKAIPGCSKC